MVLLQYEGPAYDLIYPDIAVCHLRLGELEKAKEFADKALGIDATNERAKGVLEELKRKPSKK